MMNKNIKDLSLNELKEYLISIGEKEFRAKQIFEWIYKKKTLAFKDIKVLSSVIKAKLENDFELISLNIKNKQVSEDGTIKYLFELKNDCGLIESALIPFNDENGEKSDRLTLCISSQIGCPVNCSFCATGKMGFIRNLKVSEIIDQIIIAEKDSGQTITNLVLMGMGEPLLNFSNTVEAITKISDPTWGFLNTKKITLSTVGITSKIIELADLNLKIKLAISLHSPDQKIRETLIPFAKQNQLNELINSAEYYYKQTKTPVTFEYALFDNINDNEIDAKKLAKICKRFPSKINLIRYNPIDFIFDSNLKQSDKLEEFADIIKAEGGAAFIRYSAGADISAACGQLAICD